jgi:hypothetical protein
VTLRGPLVYSVKCDDDLVDVDIEGCFVAVESFGGALPKLPDSEKGDADHGAIREELTQELVEHDFDPRCGPA